MTIKVIKREAVFIPIKGIPVKALNRVKEKLSFHFYAEKSCKTCDNLPQRPNDICFNGCAAYSGGYELASRVTVKEKKYLKIPVGSSAGILEYLNGQHVDTRLVDKSPETKIAKIKFTGTLKPEQETAVEHVIAGIRGVLKAPPRSGKCIVGNSLVMTDAGIHPIKKLFEDLTLSNDVATEAAVDVGIATAGGRKNVSGLYSKVVDSTVAVKTLEGFDVHGTPNHPVLIARPGFNLVWCRLEDIKVGDFVVCSRKEQWLGTGDKLELSRFQEVGSPTEHKHVLPKKMTTELARLLGYWVANGTLSVEHRFGFCTQNMVVYKDFVRCFRKTFPTVPLTKDLTLATPEVKLSSSYVKRFLAQACGLTMTKAAGKTIPDVLLAGDRKFMLEFIKGYISCDSWIHRNGITLTSASKQLMRELQIVLLSLGVVAGFRTSTGAAKNGSGIVRDYYGLFLHRNEADILMSQVSLLKEYHMNARFYVNQHDQLPYVKETLLEVTKKHKAPGYSANGPWLKNGILVPQTKNGKILIKDNRKGIVSEGPVNRNFLDKIDKGVLAWLDPEIAKKYEKFTNPTLFFSRVVSTRAINRPVRVYDVEVPGKHHFLANGVINHNTVMATAVVCKLRKKTLILASQRDWLMGFHETFVGSKTQAPLTNLDPNRIKLCKKLKDFEETDVCLATVQTFYSEGGEKLLRKIRDMFEVVIMDEVHTSAADKYVKIVARLNFRYGIGLSGTPARKDGKYILVENVLGPIMHEVEVKGLRPHIFLTKTKYQKDYKGNVMWARMVSSLENDKKRLELIADCAIKDAAAGHMVMIPFAQVKPINSLIEIINKKAGKQLAYPFTGQLKKGVRDETIQMAREYKIKILVGTLKIMSTGINIPRASMLYEVTMSSNLPQAEQRMRRVLTPMDNKPTCGVRYFLDDVNVRKNCMRAEYFGVMLPKIKPVVTDDQRVQLKDYFSAKSGAYGGGKLEL